MPPAFFQLSTSMHLAKMEDISSIKEACNTARTNSCYKELNKLDFRNLYLALNKIFKLRKTSRDTLQDLYLLEEDLLI